MHRQRSAPGQRLLFETKRESQREQWARRELASPPALRLDDIEQRLVLGGVLDTLGDADILADRVSYDPSLRNIGKAEILFSLQFLFEELLRGVLEGQAFPQGETLRALVRHRLGLHVQDQK